MGILNRFFGNKPEEQKRTAEGGSAGKRADESAGSEKTEDSHAPVAVTAAEDSEQQRGGRSRQTPSAPGLTPPSPPLPRSLVDPSAAKAASVDEATGHKPGKPNDTAQEADPRTAGQRFQDPVELKTPPAPPVPISSGARGRPPRHEPEERKRANVFSEKDAVSHDGADKSHALGNPLERKLLSRAENRPAASVPGGTAQRRTPKATLDGLGDAQPAATATSEQAEISGETPVSTAPGAKRAGRISPSPMAPAKATRERRSRIRTDSGSPAHTHLRAMNQGPGAAQRPAKSRAEKPVDVRAAITALFEAAGQEGGATARAQGELKVDDNNRKEIETVFAELARDRAAPIRDFAMELSLGLTPRPWAKHSQAAVKTLAQAAHGIKNEWLGRRLEKLEKALEEASRQIGPCLGQALHIELTERHQELAKAMPDVFGLGEMHKRREQILVCALLSQVPNLRKIAKDKLHAAGLHTYAGLCGSDSHELAARAGIDSELGEAIVQHFAAHQTWRESTAPDKRDELIWERLRSLVNELEKQRTAFCRADEHEDVGQKRLARQAWQAALAEVNVWLAQLDELDLAQTLQRNSLQGKIEQLKQYLQRVAGEISATNDLALGSYVATR